MFKYEIIEKVGEIKTSLRKNLWDEENRFIVVDLKPEKSTGHRLLIMLRAPKQSEALRSPIIIATDLEANQNLLENILNYFFLIRNTI